MNPVLHLLLLILTFCQFSLTLQSKSDDYNSNFSYGIDPDFLLKELDNEHLDLLAKLLTLDNADHSDAWKVIWNSHQHHKLVSPLATTSCVFKHPMFQVCIPKLISVILII